MTQNKLEQLAEKLAGVDDASLERSNDEYLDLLTEIVAQVEGDDVVRFYESYKEKVEQLGKSREEVDLYFVHHLACLRVYSVCSRSVAHDWVGLLSQHIQDQDLILRVGQEAGCIAYSAHNPDE